MDDNTGAYLNPQMVKKARAEEIEYVRQMKLYTKVSIEWCIKRTGKQPIATRWIDVSKQDEANPLYRSRLVGKEFNTYNDLTISNFQVEGSPSDALYSLIIPGLGSQKTTYGKYGKKTLQRLIPLIAITVGAKTISNKQYEKYKKMLLIVSFLSRRHAKSVWILIGPAESERP